MSQDSGEKLIHIATLKTPHGVRGLVYLECYLDDVDDLKTFPHLIDKNQQPQKFTFHFFKKNGVVVKLESIADCNAAEAAKGSKFYVTRAMLPEIDDDDEYYHADLLGAVVVNEAGKTLGTLIALPNYGASDIMEIKPEKGEVIMLPFNNTFVMEVDLSAQRITVREPEQMTVEHDEK